MPPFDPNTIVNLLALIGAGTVLCCIGLAILSAYDAHKSRKR